MFHLLRQPTYRALFSAQVMALVGTGLTTVALTLVAYALAGNAAGLVLGTVLAVKMIAYVFVAPLASAAFAHVPRPTVLVGASLTRMLVAFSLPFIEEVWQIYALVFLLQAASATFTPTLQSVIPCVLAGEEEYTQALSLSRLAYDLEAVLSPVLAAGLLVLIPVKALFLATAAGFGASILVILAAALPSRIGLSDATGEGSSAFSARARLGAVLFIQTPALRPILALNLAVASAGALVIVQSVVIVRTTFGLPENMVAVFLGISGAGSMAGALALPRLLRAWPQRRIMLSSVFLLAAATGGSALVLAASGPWRVLALAVLWFAIGLGWSGAEAPVGRIIRREAPDGDMGAVFAAQFSLSHACWLLTYPLAGILGLPGAALGLAALTLCAALAATLLWTGKNDPDQEA